MSAVALRAVAVLAVLLIAAAGTPVTSTGSSSSDSSADGFAAFFKSLCITTRFTSSATLNTYKSAFCCIDYNATTANPYCGDEIETLRSVTVLCAARSVMPAFSCCANIGATGKSSYVGMACDGTSGGEDSGDSAALPTAATSARLVAVAVMAMALWITFA